MTYRTLRMATVASLLALSACSGVTPSGLIAASQLDPLNTPPDGIAAALGVPSALRLQDGDAIFRISLSGDGPDAPVLVEEAVPLQIRRGASDAPAPNGPNEMVYVGTFSEDGARRIAAAQDDIRALRASGVDGVGSIGIDLAGGCFEGSAPEDLRLSTWIRTDPQDEFIAMSRQTDVADAFGRGTAEVLFARLQPCDE